MEGPICSHATTSTEGVGLGGGAVAEEEEGEQKAQQAEAGGGIEAQAPGVGLRRLEHGGVHAARKRGPAVPFEKPPVQQVPLDDPSM